MTTIAFTICSNNYLSHAKTLGDSYLKFHPDHKFVIGLVDRFLDNFDYSFFKDFELITAETLQIEGFEKLVSMYNIMELNTAVKPTYFKFLFNKYSPHKIIYLDPDIAVYNPLNEVFDLLDKQNIVLTPQLLSPIDYEFSLTDFHLLRDGIFNLGFIGLSNYSLVKDFLQFWHERLMKYGYGRSNAGMFYDQLWVNYVPAFYDNYAILKHPGYNMANWNLHERALNQKKEKEFIVNSQYPLCFFHFSGYKYYKPEVISASSNRYDFIKRPDLKELFENYRLALIENNIEKISKLAVYYFPPKPPASSFQKFKKRIERSLNVLIRGYE